MLAALPSLSFAAATDADALEQQYRRGMYLREIGQLDEAIQTLESLLSTEPTLSRARLELAVAYYRAFNFDRAVENAKKVAASPQTPDNVRLAVTAFLARIEADRKAAIGQKHSFTPSVSLGYLFDSNVNAGPDSAQLPGGWNLDGNDLRNSDYGVQAQAGLTHRYLAPTALSLGNGTGRFLWNTVGNVFHRGYKHQNDFDLTVTTLSTGPGVVVPNAWRAQINAQIDHIQLAGDPIANYYTLSPSYTKVLGSGELTIDALYVARNYTRQMDEARDSRYGSAGVSYGHMLPNRKTTLEAGVKLFRELADESRFSNNGFEVTAAASHAAWEHGSVYLRGAYRSSSFDGIESIYDETRTEKEMRGELGVAHVFSDGFMDKWRLGSSIVRTYNKANLDIYKYQRNQINVTLGRSF